MSIRFLALLLCIGLTLSACGDDDGSSDSGLSDSGSSDAAGEDASADSGADSGADAAGPDAGGDASAEDAGELDAGPDECPEDDSKRVPGACGCGVPDTDTDLDGLADCEDPDPEEAFATPMLGEAGSRGPMELHSKRLAAGGWDGRLYFGLINRNVGGALQTTYTAELLRPETIQRDENGRPLLAEAFAPRLEFENDTADHGFHVSFCADQRYAQNPYPSNADGTANPNGDHETYRLGIVGMDNGPEDERLKMGFGHVVIANPRSESASIVRARLDGALTEMRTGSGAFLNHYEPSVTPDCRVVVWHGRVNNDTRSSASVAMYSYNETFRVGGWSAPRSISDMHYVHGAGAPSETIVAGVPFSERYPVAAEPMRSYDGSVIPEGQYLVGPYPWISFDGSEIFFPTSINFDGPARSAVTAVGQRTGWALRHLDGAINPSRSNLVPDGNAVIFANQPLGVEVRNAYQATTLGDGRGISNNGYQRLFIIPIGLSQSMWTSEALNGPDIFPETNRAGRYAFLLSHSGRYAEVDLHQAEDAHYVVYLPMNEQMHRDAALNARILGGEFTPAQRWAQRRIALAFATDSTPDVSGSHLHAALRDGAAFPYEHNDAVGTFQAAVDRYRSDGTSLGGAAVAGDRIHGIIGNAIYFPGGSSVRSTLPAAAQTRLNRPRGMSAQLWVRRTHASDFDLMRVGNLSLRTAGGIVEASVGEARISGSALPMDEWTHLMLVVRSGIATLYQNGEAVGSDAGMFSAGASLVVGPSDSTLDDTLCLIDEVALSDLPREGWEIQDAALRVVRRSPDAPAWEGELPDDLQSLSTELPVGHGSPSSAQVALGRDLFFDTILSRDEEHSCSTCHQPARAFTDGLPQSMALGTTPRNSPAVINRLFAQQQFLDGRAASLEAQALEPLDDPLELGIGLENALERLNSDAEYRSRFEEAYGLDGAPIGPAHLAGAIASYERTLVSAGSRFDSGHFTPLELQGRGLFLGRARCSSCHRGPNLSDELFHAIGFDARLSEHEGRFAITGRESDLGRFRTPTLREVSRTAPYFHDGSAETLADVIEFYNDGGDEVHPNRDFAIQPLGLSEAEQRALVAFLETLEGSTLEDESGAIVAAPDIGGAGAPGGIWVVGVRLEGASAVLRNEAGDELATVANEAMTYSDSVTPPGWAGVWERLTFAPPASVESALDAGDTVWLEIQREGTRSRRAPLRR